jgi:hypothetical protein
MAAANAGTSRFVVTASKWATGALEYPDAGHLKARSLADDLSTSRQPLHHSNGLEPKQVGWLGYG